jgi:hypothetical protein
MIIHQLIVTQYKPNDLKHDSRIGLVLISNNSSSNRSRKEGRNIARKFTNAYFNSK